MTALPRPGHLLTIAEYAALGEDDRRRWELMEGNLVVAPRPTPRHMVALARLHAQIEAQLPADLRVVPDVDLDLQLAPESKPGSSRRPDLVVVRREEFDRIDVHGGLLSAAGTVLVVEIISPGSRRADVVIKRGEYAEAKIANYWIIDLGPPISLIAAHLAEGFGYQDSGAVTGVFEASQPFLASVDLRALG